MGKLFALSAVLLVAQQVHGLAVPAQQTACSGKYALLGVALRHYAPAVSYCQKSHSQRDYTTTVIARPSTSTITDVKVVTLVFPL
jgi:hypothetical protein